MSRSDQHDSLLEHVRSDQQRRDRDGVLAWVVNPRNPFAVLHSVEKVRAVRLRTSHSRQGHRKPRRRGAGRPRGRAARRSNPGGSDGSGPEPEPPSGRTAPVRMEAA